MPSRSWALNAFRRRSMRARRSGSEAVPPPGAGGFPAIAPCARRSSTNSRWPFSTARARAALPSWAPRCGPAPRSRRARAIRTSPWLVATTRGVSVPSYTWFGSAPCARGSSTTSAWGSGAAPGGAGEPLPRGGGGGRAGGGEAVGGARVHERRVPPDELPHAVQAAHGRGVVDVEVRAARDQRRGDDLLARVHRDEDRGGAALRARVPG